MLPQTFHTSLVETFMKSDVIEHIRLHPRFSRLPTPLCTLLWQNGQTWHKQPKAGMLRLCKNGHSVKRTVFPVPHKGVRVGGQYGTRPSEKRRTRLLQNLNSQILFKQKQRRTSSRLHGFVSPNLCVPKRCNWPRLL